MFIDIAVWIMYFITTYFAVFWLLTFLDSGVKDTSPKKLATFPLVTVAIPAYNEKDSILPTLESVLHLEYPQEKLQIIVVDDCSSDGTRSLVRDFIVSNKLKNVQLVQHQANKGKGGALNTALTLARGDFFVCLDADSFVEPKALRTILPQFSDREVAAVLPLLKPKTCKGFVQNMQWAEYLVNFFLKKIMGNLDCIHVTPGPFGSYRKSSLLAVHGFDENNLTEDLEMALRLQSHHYKIVQLLSTEVLTLTPKTLPSLYRQRNRWYKGTLLNLFRHKNLIFNRAYGELGVFHLPMVVTAAFLSLMFAFFVAYRSILLPLVEKLRDAGFIGFDFPFMMHNWRSSFSMLDFNFMLIFFTVSIFMFAFFWILLAHKHARESFVKKGIFPTLLFMTFYPFFLSFVWIGVVTDLARGKRQKW